MSSASFPSVDLACRPSRRLQAAVFVLACGALAALLMSSLPPLALVLLPVAGVPAWRSASRGDGAILRFGADGSLRVLRGDDSVAATLVSAAERGPLLVVAWRVVQARGRPCVARHCFAPDTVSAAQRRQLRLWLQRHAGNDGGLAALAGVR